MGVLLLPLMMAANARAPLPRQTAEQAVLVKRAAAQAAAATHGVAELQRMLGDAATYEYLRRLDDGSRLFALSPTELFARLVAQLDASELVHNFGDVHGGNCGQDVRHGRGPNPHTAPAAAVPLPRAAGIGACALDSRVSRSI